MNDSSNLCLSCKMCCNGTSVGFVKVERFETEKIQNVLDIETENGKGFFLQPCSKLNSCGCEIYNERPKQCANFQCNLLRSVRENKTNIHDALQIVEKAKRKKQTIEEMIQSQQINLNSNSFYFKGCELKSKYKKQSNPSRKWKDLIDGIEKLNNLFSQNTESSF